MKVVASLLFVCTGNICRSPMAQAMFQERVRQHENSGVLWQIESAGTWAEDGTPAVRYAYQTMKSRGLDISQHRARTVTGEMLGQFNLILVMETNHKEALCAEFPVLAQRIFLLSEMSDKKVSIADPIGKLPDDFVKCADEIDAWILSGWNNILRLSCP